VADKRSQQLKACGSSKKSRECFIAYFAVHCCKHGRETYNGNGQRVRYEATNKWVASCRIMTEYWNFISKSIY